jgi:hypothetical protein
MKQQAIIKNWVIQPGLSGKIKLFGDIVEHPKFEEGAPVATSEIVSINIREAEQKTVETLNTIYKLI